MWLKYSQNRFGFSVQKKIWVDNGGKLDGSYDWDTFCKLGDYDYDTFLKLGEKVGWRKGGEQLNYSELTFNNTNAPRGHLPARACLVRVGFAGWFYGVGHRFYELGYTFLFSKL